MKIKLNTDLHMLERGAGAYQLPLCNGYHKDLINDCIMAHKLLDMMQSQAEEAAVSEAKLEKKYKAQIAKKEREIERLTRLLFEKRTTT